MYVTRCIHGRGSAVNILLIARVDKYVIVTSHIQNTDHTLHSYLLSLTFAYKGLAEGIIKEL